MNKPNIQALIDSGDATTTVIESDNYVSQLCEYGDRLENLSASQRVFYLSQDLEREINNGGFDQYFVNSSGDHAHETVGALEAIGAFKTAELLRQAISKFPDGNAPSDRGERLGLMEGNITEGAFEELDQKFYAYEDPLTDLNFEWIKKNAGEF